jgi:hypothetical protein
MSWPNSMLSFNRAALAVGDMTSQMRSGASASLVPLLVADVVDERFYRSDSVADEDLYLVDVDDLAVTLRELEVARRGLTTIPFS